MFTANIVSKAVLPDGRNNIGVQFTDGATTTPTEFVIPSDKNGLDFFIKGRLDTLNFVPPAVGTYVPPVITPPVLTQAEIDFNNFSKWMQLTVALNAAKSLGWITGNEQVVLDAKTKVLALAVANIPKLFT